MTNRSLRHRPLRLWVAGICIVAGCSTEPVYQTHYDLVPPATASGKQCLNTCDTNTLLCEQRNDTQIQRCNEQAEITYNNCVSDANNRYKSCVADLQRQYGSYWQKYESNCGAGYAGNYCARPSCSAETDCRVPYRSCFANCGGTVNTSSVCVRNCG